MKTLPPKHNPTLMESAKNDDRALSWNNHSPIQEGDVVQIARTRKYAGGRAKAGELGIACYVGGTEPDQFVTIHLASRNALIDAERKFVLSPGHALALPSSERNDIQSSPEKKE